MVALFFGLYFMRSSYAWFVLAITIAVSQLYTELAPTPTTCSCCA